jgi:hypothetical protein
VRRILVTVALVACGGTKPVSNPAAEELQLQPPDAVVLDSLISSNVVAILKTKPDHFASLKYLQPMLGPRTPPCWSALEAKLVASYELHVPNVDGKGRTTYWILEGDLPRAEVERCVPPAIRAWAVDMQADGDLLSFSVPDGTRLYAAWKPPFVVVGPRDLVNGALSSRPVPRWHDLLGAVPPTVPVWWASDDGLFSDLLGVSTKHYAVAIERLELAPNRYFAGRATVTYHSAGDAAIAARRIKQGEVQLAFRVTPDILESFKRFKVKQTGAVVEIGFDLGMFGGISDEAIAMMIVKLLRAQEWR